MFDVDFSELVVIGVVALVVIGPERLPKAARTAGLLLGRLRRSVDDVKADIRREIELDELKKLPAQLQQSARDLRNGLGNELQGIEARAAATTAAPSAACADHAPAPPAGKV